MEFKFTINTDNLNDPADIEEAVEDIRLLIRFLQRANPNYYLIGNLMYDQLEEQVKKIESEKPECIKSNVPRFLEMLRDYHIPADCCVGLFKSWSSCEGDAVLAEECMHIQLEYQFNMAPVWEWLCNNKASPDIDWKKEVDIYKEAAAEE